MALPSAARELAEEAGREIPENHVGLSTPLPRYSGFPWWYALRTAPGAEERAAKRLQQYGVHTYLPTYTTQTRVRGKSHCQRLRAVIGGMLFVPVEIVDKRASDELLDFCGVKYRLRTTDGETARLGKPVIERIREMEAEINLGITTRQLAARSFKVGGYVRFLDDLLAEFWGIGTVVAIARDGRITIEVRKLLGRGVPIVVPAAKIEAMQPTTADKPPQVKAPHRSGSRSQ